MTEGSPAGTRWLVIALLLAITGLFMAASHGARAPVPLAPASANAAAPPSALSRGARIVLPVGSELTVPRSGGGALRVSSLLAVPDAMRFGEFVWNDAGVAAGPVWVRVDLDRQLISVFRAGQEIGTAVILYGAQDTPSPVGWHAVRAKARDHWSRRYDAPMPYMLRLTDDGVALHASIVREGRATHGCIGLPYAFAARLFDAMRVGDPVLVVGTHRS